MDRNKRASTNEPFDGGQMVGDAFDAMTEDETKDLVASAHSLHPHHYTSSQSSDDVFFASGPFYAHLDDLDDEEEEEEEELTNCHSANQAISRLKSPFDLPVDHSGRRSNTRCNVLYAEMPPNLSSSFTNPSVNSRFSVACSNSNSKSSNNTNSSNGGKLKLKNLLMFGSNHKSATSSNSNSAATSPPPLDQAPLDSFCCLVHQQQQQQNSHKCPTQSSFESNKSGGSHKSSQPPRKTPFSPKMNPFHRILSTSQELFSHHKHKSSSSNSSSSSAVGHPCESSIRVIKPTAIRPQPPPTAGNHVFEDPSPYLDDENLRPATSADYYQHFAQQPGSLSSRKPLSAFHQVGCNGTTTTASVNAKFSQHFRSNSLAESFVYPPPHVLYNTQPLPPLPQHRSGKLSSTMSNGSCNTSVRPRSSDGRQSRRANRHSDGSELAHTSFDQGSLDSIYSMSHSNNHLSRRPIDSEQEPIHMTLEEVRRIAFGAPASSVKTSSDPGKTLSSSKLCDNDYGSAPRPLQQTSKQTKSKLKLAFENILHKTHCIGPNSPGSSSPSSSKNVYSPTVWDHFQHQDSSTPSFIPNGYRRINIEDQNPLTLQRIKKQRESEPNSSSSIASPFIRRALPPLPRNDDTGQQKQSPQQQQQQVLSTVDSDQEGETLTATMQPPPTSNATNSNNALTSSAFVSRLRSHGYRSVLAGLGSKRSNMQLSSMTPEERQRFLDYATSIERVKNCGWYWGPVCGEMAEKLLETEPCGSFIVRDSSDEHYIFSLTFKLNGVVRHVRIEHDQGNFSFGSLQKYRSNTIVDFIESAVEHSRSGQFLFFLHRHSNGNLIEPVLPVRVQLLNPISRFRQVQSLQHNCRFTILKHVRRDQIHQLPLPDPLHVYLDTPYYYSEELANLQESMKREKQPDRECKKEEDRRRKQFMKTDHRTLVGKMLIDRVTLETALNIELPVEIYGMEQSELSDEVPATEEQTVPHQPANTQNQPESTEQVNDQPLESNDELEDLL